MDLIQHIQLDQAQRQALVDWRKDQEAISLLAAVANANIKADKSERNA